MQRETGSFKIIQGGEVVAKGWGTWGRIQAEAMHYAMVYGQDGNVEVKFKKDRRADA